MFSTTTTTTTTLLFSRAHLLFWSLFLHPKVCGHGYCVECLYNYLYKQLLEREKEQAKKDEENKEAEEEKDDKHTAATTTATPATDAESTSTAATGAVTASADAVPTTGAGSNDNINKDSLSCEVNVAVENVKELHGSSSSSTDQAEGHLDCMNDSGSSAVVGADTLEAEDKPHQFEESHTKEQETVKEIEPVITEQEDKPVITEQEDKPENKKEVTFREFVCPLKTCGCAVSYDDLKKGITMPLRTALTTNWPGLYL